MERDLAGAAISADEFGRLEKACRHDVRFPRTFSEWCELVNAGDQKLLVEGAQVVTIPIEVDDFVAWCQRVDVAPCLDGLLAYLILIRRRQHIPGKSPTGPRAKSRASLRRIPPETSSLPAELRGVSGPQICGGHLVPHVLTVSRRRAPTAEHA